jgi:myo-inositol-1(or 4)-monophosphatase
VTNISKPETPLHTISEDLALILSATEEARRIALSYFHGHKEMDVRMKGGTSPVSAGDFAVDNYLREFLMAARPDYGWLSEESAEPLPSKRQTAARAFIVDPIDGTRAYVDGRDIWCISIGVVETGAAIAGVLDCPALGVRYWASAGEGAWKDDRRLKTSPPAKVPVIAAPKAILHRLVAAFPGGIHHHQHVPSLAYRLALVAEGVLDATVVKPNSHDWDIAAAEIILREAGARITLADGAEVILNGENVVKPAMIAGTQRILGKMFGVVTADAFG